MLSCGFQADVLSIIMKSWSKKKKLFWSFYVSFVREHRETKIYDKKITGVVLRENPRSINHTTNKMFYIMSIKMPVLILRIRHIIAYFGMFFTSVAYFIWLNDYEWFIYYWIEHNTVITSLWQWVVISHSVHLLSLIWVMPLNIFVKTILT